MGRRKGNQALIDVVTHSEQSLSRRDAITELRRRKAVEAAGAIAGRLPDDALAAGLALREFGPAAEPAVLARLADPNPKSEARPARSSVTLEGPRPTKPSKSSATNPTRGSRPTPSPHYGRSPAGSAAFETSRTRCRGC